MKTLRALAWPRSVPPTFLTRGLREVAPRGGRSKVGDGRVGGGGSA